MLQYDAYYFYILVVPFDALLQYNYYDKNSDCLMKNVYDSAPGVHAMAH